MAIVILGIDLGKNICSCDGQHARHKPTVKPIFDSRVPGAVTGARVITTLGRLDGHGPLDTYQNWQGNLPDAAAHSAVAQWLDTTV